MKIELIRLRITHFKGIKSMEVNFGSSTTIKGDNATGKTTVMDAFLWLLFGKDSTDRRDFEVKHISSNGSPKQVDVEGLLIVGNRRIILKRVFAEKWTKKRGAAEAEFTGHETTLFYNDVPVNVRDYQEKIDDICGEVVFKMITHPFYFNSLHWEAQRKILFDMAGDEVTDESVAKGKPEFEALLHELTGKTLLEYKKQVASQKRKINDTLELIPARIDEVTRSMPKERNWQELSAQLNMANTELQSVEESISDLSKAYQQQYQAKIILQKDIHHKREHINELVAKHWELELKNHRDLKAQNVRIRTDIENIRRDIHKREIRIAEILKETATNENARNKLRDQWHQEQSRQFDAEQAICPTCSRPYETDKAEDMQASFNLSKVANLTNIAEHGKTLKSEHEDFAAQIQNLQDQVQQMQKIIKGLENEIQLVEEPEVCHEKIPGYVEALATLNQIEAEHKKAIPQPDVVELKRQKLQLQSAIGEFKATLSTKDQLERAKQRVSDLEREEKILYQELVTLEKAEFIMLNFEKAKADAIEVKVSSRFKLVKWRLFEKQINGQEIPTCKATYQGVPFSDLNSAAKVNIGLDIINTLSAYYGVTAPIFIDNREGINQLIDTPSQIISLCVSKDPELVIETLTV